MIEQAQPLTSVLEQLVVDFLTLLPNLIAALVVFAIGVYLASIVRRLVRKGLQRRTKNPQPITLLSQLAYWLVVILAAAISLQMVGFNLTAFLAGLGIVGITGSHLGWKAGIDPQWASDGLANHEFQPG
jgi:small conductance mechanosensitive channel